MRSRDRADRAPPITQDYCGDTREDLFWGSLASKSALTFVGPTKTVFGGRNAEDFVDTFGRPISTEKTL